MDQLKAYQLLARVKPAYFQTRTPYQTAHNRRITYNQRELELHYNEDLGVYVRVREPKTGGRGEQKKITFIAI